MLTSALPYCFCIAVLILMAYREQQHQRLVRNLINTILTEKGIEPLPEPVHETVVEPEPEPEQSGERIRVPIPGMAAFQAMAQLRARTVKGK